MNHKKLEREKKNGKSLLLLQQGETEETLERSKELCIICLNFIRTHSKFLQWQILLSFSVFTGIWNCGFTTNRHIGPPRTVLELQKQKLMWKEGWNMPKYACVLFNLNWGRLCLYEFKPMSILANLLTTIYLLLRQERVLTIDSLKSFLGLLLFILVFILQFYLPLWLKNNFRV